jgi:hypothetical protein
MQRDASLVAIVGKPEEALFGIGDILVERPQVPAGTTPRRLYPDNVSPQIAEDLAPDHTPSFSEVEDTIATEHSVIFHKHLSLDYQYLCASLCLNPADVFCHPLSNDHRSRSILSDGPEMVDVWNAGFPLVFDHRLHLYSQ